MTSANASGPLVVIHEYGHSFPKLADEYTSAYPASRPAVTSPHRPAKPMSPTRPRRR
ncbi:MAG: hypothetical protein IPG63_17555 [Xanthomonadales bacterium]|nr:hypothetical protein [Xanthomonadales bacterium]